MQRYTEQELKSMDIMTLKAICQDLKIRVESLDFYTDKAAMVQMIYKYRGTMSERYINEWHDVRVQRLKNALKNYGDEQKNIRVEIPAYFTIYKGIDSLNERGKEHKVHTEADIDMTSAVLVDQDGDIQAILNVFKGPDKNTYFLKLREHMVNYNIKTGIYKNYKIIFFTGDFKKITDIYDLDEKNTRFTYISKVIQEVVIEEIRETSDVLVIDYGTSYTTAGTYIGDEINHIWFYSDEVCERNPDKSTRYADCSECGYCALCPSVIAVKECSKDKNTIELLFGHEAKNRMPMARNSIFFDTKRWVNDYTEIIDVKDFEGNTASIRRNEIIERFMKYIIHVAEQQNKVRYKNICFTSPVKQKAMSIRMYKDILKGYNVEERDAIDEAVAVIYNSIAQTVKNLSYKEENKYERNVLLIDCGGSTSDMVKCDYEISNHQNRSNIKMTVGYANGDTNFGGNNLTYRIMQYLKIKLAQHYEDKRTKKETVVSVDNILNISYYDIFDFIDKFGIKKAYEDFEEAYRKANNSIPTNFSDYINDAETIYFNVRGNFYFLWNLAEKIKIELYSSSGAYEFSFDKLKQLKGSKFLYVLSVRNERGVLVTYTEYPSMRVLRDEINLLLKPEIYNLLKKFIEPYYNNDDTMSEINNIMLSGQTTKIELFRDVLKEYIAGHKARAQFEHSYSKKLKCIKGAVAYHGAKTIGRIRSTINYESAVVPYYLTIETFNEEKEKILIKQGQLLSTVYSYVDRPDTTRMIVFKLKNHDREILQELKFNMDVNKYKATDYDELLRTNIWLKQGDIDRIDDGDVRIFVYSNDDSWGFKWLGIANNDSNLFCGEEKFVPFESTAWEMNFFDGKR